MLNVTLTILALLVACLLVWFAVRRSKMVQRVSGDLSGPVEQMQEQIFGKEPIMDSEMIM